MISWPQIFLNPELSTEDEQSLGEGSQHCCGDETWTSNIRGFPKENLYVQLSQHALKERFYG